MFANAYKYLKKDVNDSMMRVRQGPGGDDVFYVLSQSQTKFKELTSDMISRWLHPFAHWLRTRTSHAVMTVLHVTFPQCACTFPMHVNACECALLTWCQRVRA